MCQSKANGGKRCALHQRGSRAMVATIRVTNSLDTPQAEAVFRKAYAKARPAANPPSPEKWTAFCDEQMERLALDWAVEANQFDDLARRLQAAKSEVPDAQTFAALKDLTARAEKAEKALRRQREFVAALRGVSSEEAEERLVAYRAQYKREFASRPAAERPDPPAEWVEGFTTKDLMAVSAPADRATLYAMYRCQADPEAFPQAAGDNFASIDLETAGPAGREGFEPQNGSIIEVGIIEYDRNGTETGRYSQLVAPAPEVLAVCGTGAVDVHGIRPEDVADAPQWATVAPQVAQRLQGRTMMAQNARFERTWLAHHLGGQGENFDAFGPTVDTMCVAQQHLGLPNNRLATICEAVGVEYTDGHRATHDAEVAARAFFALRKQIGDTYAASPARVAAGQPPLGFGARRKKSVLTRLKAGDFNPTEVADPWVQPQTAAPVVALSA